jgi:hypothetical protein
MNIKDLNESAKNRIQEDLVIQLLYSQIRTLCKVVSHIQTGNQVNNFVDENIKCVEKDLRWLRKSCLNN